MGIGTPFTTLKYSYFFVFLLEKEVERLIAEANVAEKSNEVVVDGEIPDTELCEVEQQSVDPIIYSNLQSVSIQTEYFAIVRNKKVQTLDIDIAPCKTMKSKATQTLLTSDYLSRKLCPVKLVSSVCQTSTILDGNVASTNTDAFENASPLNENIYPLASVNEDGLQLTSGSIRNIPLHEKIEDHQKNPPMKQLFSNPLPLDEITEEKEQESDDEENYNPSDDDEEESANEGGKDEEETICNNENERVMLSSDKPPKDQLKFIVFEESLANLLHVCFKCNAWCNVFLEHQIGTYCKIGVFCSGNPSHDFLWTTGPLCNRLPILNLMIAASIVSTGMEPSKTLRFLQSLKIMCIERREFSNLQQAYVIPAVFRVWKREQLRLLQDIKNKPIVIASDMRVDSPGHSGLLGSGSSLDIDRNVILDTQVIKVICLSPHFKEL